MSVKPKIIVQDFSGEHGKDLAATHSRLMQGASWKTNRIVVIIPTSEMISAKVCLAIWNLAFPPNEKVARILAVNEEVGVAYSKTIEHIITDPVLSQWEFILTIEHDNLPPPDGAIRLVEKMHQHPEFAAIGGLYFTKGYAGVAQIWGDIKDPILNFRPQLPDKNGSMVECVGVAMGFTLFRISMFKDQRIARPLFKTLRGNGGEGYGTQDLSFWAKARGFGYRCAIDCSVRVGHYDMEGRFGPPDMVW